MNYTHPYLELLQREVVPAIGCTEPIAIALACALARETLFPKTEAPSNPDSIELTLSRNIIKNALSVGIPGTDMFGIPIAAALGYAAGKSEKKLEVIGSATQEQIQRAKNLIENNIIKIKKYSGPQMLFVQAAITVSGHNATVIIQNDHTHVTAILKDQEPIFQAENNKADGSTIAVKNQKTNAFRKTLSVHDIFRFIESVDVKTLGLIGEGAAINKAIALEGLCGEYGLQVGRTTKKNADKNSMSENMVTYAVELASAASDARMAGSTLPVMTNSGSGNQGITVFLPVMAAAEKLNVSEDVKIKALTISNLIAIHAKQKTGKLSGLCGAMTAGIGAAAGITYLLGGCEKQVSKAIQNMIGDLTGIICDGAKCGCALKVATVVEASFRSAMLAIDNFEVSKNDGIIEEEVEKSLTNLGRISLQGMEQTDNLILDIMLDKQNRISS